MTAAKKRTKAEKPAKPNGRPTIFNAVIWAELIDRISGGEPLQQICRDEHMPKATAVYDWTEPSRKPASVPASLSEDFARARARGHDAIAAEALRIADDDVRDWTLTKDDAGNITGVKVDGEHVQRSKLRIETRLKLLAKWDKRYADRIDQTLSAPDGGPVRYERVERVIIDPKAPE